MTKVTPENMKKQYEDLWNTFCKKNHDYGSSFEQSLDKHGLIAGVVRMEDKLNRISTLVDIDKHAEIASESLADTLRDLSNYAAMSACWLMHKDDDSMYDSDRIFSISTDIYTKDFQMLSAVINGSVEEEENPLKLSNFEGHEEKVNEREQYQAEEQPLTTELKGLENGYVIRQHKNSHNSYRYTLAFNPEGTLKVEGDVAKPYVIECFSNDHYGTNTWAIHVFDTREDMVAALNYDLKVSNKNCSKRFRDSIGNLDVAIDPFDIKYAIPVTNTWIHFFGPSFVKNMTTDNILNKSYYGIKQGVKTFRPLFISEKTGALVVKGRLRERTNGRIHSIIWFSDTKEVLLELNGMVPKFNIYGIIYGINSEHVNNGKYIEFNPLYQTMVDKILYKFNSWDESKLKNLVFFNEDDEVSCEFMDKKFQIPSDSPSANAKNTVGLDNFGAFPTLESVIYFTDSEAYWGENLENTDE